MSQAKKRGAAGTGIAIAAALILLVVAAVVTSGFTNFSLSSILGSGNNNGSPSPTGSGFTAYCAGSTVTVAGVYPAGTGTTPPPGCYANKQLVSVQLQDLYDPADPPSNSYSCIFYMNTGSSAIFSQLGPGRQGVQITGGTWIPAGPGVQASNSGVCSPPGWTVNTGTQVVVKVCIDSSATCASSDYSNQKTVAYCPLPSLAPTVTPTSSGMPASSVCNPGPGWGSVPYTQTLSTTAPTVLVTAPIVVIAGQNPAGSHSGYNSATPILLDERYQNGTDFTAASTCYVNTGANACDLPKATSLGSFSMVWGLTTGGAGTAPANPAGSGYMSIYPVDLQSGTQARGLLQLVLSIEVKTTTNTDMCAVSIPSLPTPIVIQKSGSATDTFYIYPLTEQALTKVTDQIGSVINNGKLQLAVSLNCGPVYNGSGDVVTITPIVYGYFSIGYVQATTLTTLNPESSTFSQSAVITVRT